MENKYEEFDQGSFGDAVVGWTFLRIERQGLE
jgi:hypothetical protein